ncbi:MAG: hypothetical protein RTU30_06885 [Candidatus Thorarchaeota archaeon]
MSALEERPLDKLADMIYNVLWQDLMEIWKVIRSKMDSEGPAAVKTAFEGAIQRFLDGAFKEMQEVRWGISLCPLCNDENIDKNGVAYPQPSGDGLEFNQCMNCRIGVLYNLVVANATMETYVIGVGMPDQYEGMSFYWDAITTPNLKKFWPMYEVLSKGQWKGTISFDENMTPRFLPFDAMTVETPRDSDIPWTDELPADIKAAVDAFVASARPQIEIALALR